MSAGPSVNRTLTTSVAPAAPKTAGAPGAPGSRPGAGVRDSEGVAGVSSASAVSPGPTCASPSDPAALPRLA